MNAISRKARVFWPVCSVLLVADCTAKNIAVDRLAPTQSLEVVDGLLRFTLSFNRGAGMGMSLGEFSRIGFGLAAVVAIVLLARVYRQTPSVRTWQLVALALVCGGAAGNLLDRLRSDLGVVDFIDVGFGDHRFWIFNLADAGLSIGALMLAVMLWRQERRQPRTP